MKRGLVIAIMMVIGIAGCMNQADTAPPVQQPEDREVPEEAPPVPDTGEDEAPDEPEDTAGNVKVKEIGISSPAFKAGDEIPSKYSCEGMNVNPALIISGLPHRAQSMVVVLEYVDSQGGVIDHWVMWNAEPIEVLPEDTAPGVEGINDFGTQDYEGPCPTGQPHKYYYRVYLLDTELDIPEDSDRDTVQKAMRDHIIAKGQLMGIFT